MRILFLRNSFEAGGYETLILAVFRALVNDGATIETVCLEEPGTLAPALDEIGIPVHTCPFKGPLDFWAAGRIRKKLQSGPFDLVFLEAGRNVLLAGEYLHGKLGRPMRIASIEASVDPSAGEEGLFHARGHRRLLKRADLMIACAETQARDLVRRQKLNPSLLKTIVNGVDHEKYRPVPRDQITPFPNGPQPGERSICMVGSLYEEKGHRFFVEAARETLREVPDARFYIIGEGPAREAILAQIRDAGLEERIVLLGVRDDLADILPHFNAIALTSLRETLALAPIEGMACGLPAICTDVGSVRDLVVDGETGFVVPPADVNAIAAAFSRMLSNVELRARMAAASRKRVEEKFTQERAVREYVSTFRRYAGEPDPAVEGAG
ncbi:MAG: glycosyltransferase family 4 protein [Gemmatimonadetes bacterium]|nr:glycosyltransferase family 4 protein [Gemmatimonadota bacterium]